MYGNTNTVNRAPKHGIFFLSNCFGLCVLGFLLLQQFILVIIEAMGLYDLYRNNSLFQTALNIPITLIAIGVPFYIAFTFLRKKNLIGELPLNPPKSPKTTVLLIGLGLLACSFGNIVSSVFVVGLNSIGITLTSPSVDVPEGVFGKILFILYVAVLPALLEEFAIRGVVMQPLRRYGDGFAIIASSLIFALMHGNWVQAPFAFIAGIGIGYTVVLSGSMWTGIIIHLVNNLFSATMSILQSAVSENVYDAVVLISSAAIAMFGLICVAVFVFSHEKLYVPNFCHSTYTGINFLRFIFSPLMVIALGIMTVMTRFYVQMPSNFFFRAIIPTAFFVLWAVTVVFAIWHEYRNNRRKPKNDRFGFYE